LAAKKAAKRVGAKKKVAPAKKKAAVPAKKHGRRKDFGGPIESYISTLIGEQRDIGERLRTIIKKAAPGAEEQLKWGMPVYSKDGLLCYFRAFGGHVSFGFYDHVDVLQDPERVLEGTGKGAHVKLRHVDDVNPARFEAWVRAVAAKNAQR
jgi:hypothetical protein